MDGLVLYHLKWFIVVLQCDVPAIYVGVEFFQSEGH